MPTISMVEEHNAEHVNQPTGCQLDHQASSENKEMQKDLSHEQSANRENAKDQSKDKTAENSSNYYSEYKRRSDQEWQVSKENDRMALAEDWEELVPEMQQAIKSGFSKLSELFEVGRNVICAAFEKKAELINQKNGQENNQRNTSDLKNLEQLEQDLKACLHKARNEITAIRNKKDASVTEADLSERLDMLGEEMLDKVRQMQTSNDNQLDVQRALNADHDLSCNQEKNTTDIKEHDKFQDQREGKEQERLAKFLNRDAKEDRVHFSATKHSDNWEETQMQETQWENQNAQQANDKHLAVRHNGDNKLADLQQQQTQQFQKERDSSLCLERENDRLIEKWLNMDTRTEIQLKQEYGNFLEEARSVKDDLDKHLEKLLEVIKREDNDAQKGKQMSDTLNRRQETEDQWLRILKKASELINNTRNKGTQEKAVHQVCDEIKSFTEKVRQLSFDKKTDAKKTVLVVKESNLFYDIDHYEAQHDNPSLSNKASNLGFLTADENRRKGTKIFRHLPEQKKTVWLKDILLAERSEKEIMSDILPIFGSLRFSEIGELNLLWQEASNNETIQYDTAQKKFRHLIATNQSEAAKLVRQAFEKANIQILKKEKSEGYVFRMADDSYRQTEKIQPSTEVLSRLNRRSKPKKLA